MFYSILYPVRELHKLPRQTDEPVYFEDLCLDQIFTPILASAKEFELGSFFYTALNDPNIVTYRQEVMRELENEKLRDLLAVFSNTIYTLGKQINSIRSSLSSSDSWHNNYLTRGRMLDYAGCYCNTVTALSEELSGVTLNSTGLRSFADYLFYYSASDSFISLQRDVKKLRKKLSTVEYCMLIKNGTIRIRKYEGQADQSMQILSVFEKFRQGNVKDYRDKLPEEPYAAHVEAAVLEIVAKLYKDIFAELNTFRSRYFHFDDETIMRFSKEIQFYLTWHNFIKPLKEAGLPFNYPKICRSADRLYSFDGFDLALANIKLGKTVTNDFVLNAPEHIIVVTGPNQGGKTTFARAFGQMHYLASLGLAVPGRKTALFLFDNIYTHFGREEDLSTLHGKLQDDLIRLNELFKKATDQSVIIINEIFTSTTLSDSLSLSRHMIEKIAALGAPSIIVTFLDELATYSEKTVSMMSTVQDDDPAQRTYKIIRKPPDGLAYAMHIAEKYGVNYEQLCKRLIN